MTKKVDGLEVLIGRRVSEVWFSDWRLTFVTDQGEITYRVEGDCCSSSYFHDFVGVDKLYDNGPVTDVNSIELDYGAKMDELTAYNAKMSALGKGTWGDDCTQFYGYEIVTVHPKWGEQTTVFSFRNESNGYYGGWLVGPLTNTFRQPDQELLIVDRVLS